ncbi:FecCD family ABC transporter permease [Lutimonas zeaxanthinifaciens]|uniref:FecCD family ABC transporter permease n=1 Tax=Lutimonas zeaxanthinifaciens TaxID=3060215 RepID=UPI003D18768C
MKNNPPYTIRFLIFFFLMVLLFLLNISLGSVNIPLSQVLKSLAGATDTSETWNYIVLDYRLPKAITALLVGSGLSICGLLMQTLFRNPLAGPYVLGISSGASLGVALLIMGSSIVGGSMRVLGQSQLFISLAASIGAFLVLFAVMIVSRQVKNTMSILIIGLMFSSLTSAVISVLSYFSSAENLQQYMFWGFGSLGNLTWNEVMIFTCIYLLAGLMLLPVIKSLNSLLLGENYAKSIGINIKTTKNLILLATSLLAGVITAFAGPIAFIGLAAPHMTKLLLNTSEHKIILPAAALLGANIMLISDTVAQLPTSEYTLPINAITTLFGAPIVIWLLLRKKKMVL